MGQVIAVYKSCGCHWTTYQRPIHKLVSDSSPRGEDVLATKDH